MKLSNLAKIQSGFTIRDSRCFLRPGGLKMIQATDIIPDETLEDITSLVSVEFDTIPVNSMARPGDVLLTVRASSAGSHKASVYRGEKDMAVVVSTSCIIRVIDGDVIPEYLALYLNSSLGQLALQKIAVGAVIKTLPIREIRLLDLPVPLCEVQEKAVQLLKNVKRQKTLFDRRAQLINQLYTGAVQRIAKN